MRRSVVATAAYRSGERLFDASQGRWFEYDKPDVVFREILVPEGANHPDWIFDRQTLWNMVERSEKRVDAQLCREVELTLPRELSPQQRIDLVRSFVKAQFVSHGMVADYAIHNPAAVDRQEQPHAHVMLTLRRLDPDSETGFARTKERDWNETEAVARLVAEARKKFNNTDLADDREALEKAEALRNVNVWRRTWAEAANAALADAGSDARIDHRTLEKQGIFRLPQISLGIARHIEKAYDFLKERVTQWVGIKKRSRLYEEAEHLKKQDPIKLTNFVLQLTDLAESFAADFRRPDLAPERSPPPPPDKERGIDR